MQIERDRVVRFHYEIRTADGESIETSRDGEAAAVLYGRGELVPGVERALAGKAAGDRFDLRVEPKEAYGERRDSRIRRVQRKHLANPKRVRKGMEVMLQTETGPRRGTVAKVGATVVDVDFNHPLAGHTLDFAIEVVEVREAEPEEIAHGHVHGPGGHAHG